MTVLRFLPDHIYHIYNRGNNFENIFFEERNYYYFLDLVQKYISPVADTLAFCLLLNHFHFLIHIKALPELPEGPQIHQRFSNLFNAYSKAINRAYGRRGSLFEKSLKRKVVDTDQYLRTLVVYIHRNPQTHGLVEDFRAWPYSSHPMITRANDLFLNRSALFRHFDGLTDFLDAHHNTPDDGIFEITRW